MNLSKLLGLTLKDDDMLNILEDYDIENVTYDFDRFHENTPDIYWAGSEAEGFLLRFNQNQVCDVVFCYIQATDSYSAIDPNIIGVTPYTSFALAEKACKQQNLKYTVAGASMKGAWLRIEDGDFITHFQFSGGALSLVTLTSHDAQ